MTVQIYKHISTQYNGLPACMLLKSVSYVCLFILVSHSYNTGLQAIVSVS